jgi:hypothetical protein
MYGPSLFLGWYAKYCSQFLWWGIATGLGFGQLVYSERHNALAAGNWRGIIHSCL